MVTGKLPPVNYPLEDCPPTNLPWVRAWARVRVGGNLSGDNLPGGNFLSTISNKLQYPSNSAKYQ